MVGPDKTRSLLARQRRPGRAGAKYPDRFAGYVGAQPMDNPDAAVKEAERILIDGNANGLQLHTNVNGRFLPIFEVAAKSGKPICCIGAEAGRSGFPPKNFPNTRSDHLRVAYETSATMAR